jgi:SAM-dependent methyltransferase
MLKGIVHGVRAEVLRQAWALGVWEPSDRRVLDGVILPHYRSAAGFERMLFVGCKKYNAKNRALFAGRSYATVDPNPEVARFGGSPHIVGRVEEVEAHLGRASVDVVVMNGVIGFGLDEPAAVERAIDACRAILRPGGELVLGVNELLDTHVDLASVQALTAGFSPFVFAPLGAARHTVETPFREKTHTFAFHRRRD